MNGENLLMTLVSIVIIGVISLIGIEMHKDKMLTELCLSNGYAEQRRTSADGYCIKLGKDGETIVTNAKDLK